MYFLWNMAILGIYMGGGENPFIKTNQTGPGIEQFWRSLRRLRCLLCAKPHMETQIPFLSNPNMETKKRCWCFFKNVLIHHRIHQNLTRLKERKLTPVVWTVSDIFETTVAIKIIIIIFWTLRGTTLKKKEQQHIGWHGIRVLSEEQLFFNLSIGRG